MGESGEDADRYRGGPSSLYIFEKEGKLLDTGGGGGAELEWGRRKEIYAHRLVYARGKSRSGACTEKPE